MSDRPTEWWPSKLLNGERSSSPYAVLILNQPINEVALKAVVNGAELVVCADGGANRLFDLRSNGHEEFVKVNVDAIVGDLDSLLPEVEDHFRRQGVLIEKDPDQYSTDFTKGLKWIRKHLNREQGAVDDKAESHTELDVVAIGGLGGRVDQGFSQIHHLYLAQDDRQLLYGRLYLLSEQSLSFVLDAGENVIHIDQDAFAENVGIIPVLGLTTITTDGLEWDVENWKTEFGGQISTSNHIKSGRVMIRVEGKRPLFTVELGHRLISKY